MSRDESLRILSAALLVSFVVLLGFTPDAPAQNKFTPVYNFTGGADGAFPQDSLIFDGKGNLYGTTAQGGDSQCAGFGCGVVFKLTPKTGGGWTESVLYAFHSRSEGENPYGGVIFDGAGNLYGTTQIGGSGGDFGGTVFKLTRNRNGSWTESVLYNFCSLGGCADGEIPEAGLIFDTKGNLYGTTLGGGGGGVVFKLTPQRNGKWTESVLYRFCSRSNCDDGAGPAASVIFDGAGNLYGTASGGGSTACNGGCGVVFELLPRRGGSWKEKVLHHFTGGEDGGVPLGGLISDGAGNLYSTTVFGGNFGCNGGDPCGVVFKLTPNADGSWKEKVLHRFAGRDGGLSYAGLAFDGSGNLYGTTEVGGHLSSCVGVGCGVVFKLAPNSKGGWKETVMHAFTDHPGALPIAGVIFDAAGNLYGTTHGSATTWGSVFEIAH